MPAQPGFVLAVCLGRVDNVVAVIEPARDQRLDHVWRVLAIAVHEQDGAEAGVVEAGEKRGFLAEIARQRDDLNIERQRRQALATSLVPSWLPSST